MEIVEDVTTQVHNKNKTPVSIHVKSMVPSILITSCILGISEAGSRTQGRVY
jgi:hypothetical protein